MNSATLIKQCFLAVIYLLLPCLATAQNPFNFGKTKERYFLSREEIRKLGISQIYTVTEELDGGGMNQEISLSILDFSDSTEIRDGWFVYSGQRNPPLDTLIGNTQFVNGAFWSFEGGKLMAAGTGGYGTHCYTDFGTDPEDSAQANPLIREAQLFCKHQRGEKKRLVHYHKNGLVNFVVYFPETVDPADLDPEQAADYTAPLPDTLFFVYDAKGRILGSKTSQNQTGYSPIFQKALDYSAETTNQHPPVYIGKTGFEKLIDRKIGFRPKLLLFEVYPHAVIPFVYDARQKRYFQYQALELESGEWVF